MNGARTDPFAKISSAPTSIMMMIMGMSQNFFLTRMNAHSSLNRLTLLTGVPLELAFEVAAPRGAGRPSNPECPAPRAHQRVITEKAPDETDRRQHHEVDQSHEDRRRDLREPSPEAHPGSVNRAQERWEDESARHQQTAERPEDDRRNGVPPPA